MIVSQYVADHCARYRECKGCPLGTCVAPLCEVTDPRWQQWLDEMERKVREAMK